MLITLWILLGLLAFAAGLWLIQHRQPPRPLHGRPMRSPLPAAVDAQIQPLLRDNRKIDAIQLVRERSGWNLKQAKDYIDRLGT